jgi:hypothetical protein
MITEPVPVPSQDMPEAADHTNPRALYLLFNPSACGFSSWARLVDGLAHVMAGSRAPVFDPLSWRASGAGA